MKKIFLTLVGLTMSQIANAALDLDAVYGRYELARERQGMCAQEVWVQEEDPTLETDTPTVIIGQYYFPRVNAGSFVRDDQFERAELRSYTSRSGVVFNKRSYDKILRRSESQTTTAQFRGEHMFLSNQYVGELGTTTRCDYRRARN